MVGPRPWWRRQVSYSDACEAHATPLCPPMHSQSKALMSPGLTATEGTNSTLLSNKMGKELESWCSEKQRNKLVE
ncbi:hypothetical protein GWK47_033866 [Chionoecetes opilio]|uniref:Uncharacterized protein n=1 Tax=Chionoecetes opilio TaxID=41210 RepID=A0A8J5D3U2_CHIOP|nr:hypothetical protein GWK47_033866 [Chionoecetes opilio]